MDITGITPEMLTEMLAFLTSDKQPQWAKDMSAQLQKLEDHMSLQDDKIDAFVTQQNATNAATATALDNIAADEAKLQADLAAAIAGAAGDLSTANMAKLQAVADAGAAQTAKIQAIADAIPDAVTP